MWKITIETRRAFASVQSCKFDSSFVAQYEVEWPLEISAVFNISAAAGGLGRLDELWKRKFGGNGEDYSHVLEHNGIK